MNEYRHLRRNDLFLVRVWRDEAEDAEEADVHADGGDGCGKTAWCGRVQRVVDGESHQFRSWQGLVDSLLAMLSHSDVRW